MDPIEMGAEIVEREAEAEAESMANLVVVEEKVDEKEDTNNVSDE